MCNNKYEPKIRFLVMKRVPMQCPINKNCIIANNM